MFWNKKVTPQEAWNLVQQKQAQAAPEPEPPKPPEIQPQQQTPDIIEQPQQAEQQPKPIINEPIKETIPAKTKPKLLATGAGKKKLITTTIVKRLLIDIKISDNALRELEIDLIKRINQAKQRAIANHRKKIHEFDL